jgi:hypothetical protein
LQSWFSSSSTFLFDNCEIEEVKPLEREVYNTTDPDLCDKLIKSLSYNMIDDLLNLVFWGLTMGNKLIRFATLVIDERELSIPMI